MEGMKRCRRCGEWFPYHMFYPDAKSKDGLAQGCKACRAAAEGTTYKGKRNKHREVPDGFRFCPKCERVLPVVAFAKASHKKSGYQAHCKDCRRETRPRLTPPPEPLPEGMKKCWDCERILPGTSEFFSIDKRSPTGLQTRCKDCYRNYRAANRERINQQKKEHYQNNREEIRQVVKERYHENIEDSRKKQREYYHSNLEQIRRWNKLNYYRHISQRRAYYEAHREEQYAYHRAYVERNRERLNQISRERHKANPEKKRADAKLHRQRYPEKVKLAKKRWYESWRASNLKIARETSRIKEARRRARKRELPDTFTLQEWKICLEYWDQKCCICAGNQQIHADHWIALSDANCPGTTVSNMIALCRQCNLAKNARNPVVWLVEKLGEEKAAAKLAEIEAYFEYVKSLLERK